MDANIILFHFLSLGVMAMIEFQDNVTVSADLSPLGPVPQPVQDALSETVVFEGNQYFIGPVVGLHFGG
jgi:hypothetical protein